jgi:hypothetical protein
MHYSEIAKEKFVERFCTELTYVWQTQYKDKNNFDFDRDAYAESLSNEDEIRILFVCL